MIVWRSRSEETVADRAADQRARAQSGDLPTCQAQSAGLTAVAVEGGGGVVAVSTYWHSVLSRHDVVTTTDSWGESVFPGCWGCVSQPGSGSDYSGPSSSEAPGQDRLGRTPGRQRLHLQKKNLIFSYFPQIFLLSDPRTDFFLAATDTDSLTSWPVSWANTCLGLQLSRSYRAGLGWMIPWLVILTTPGQLR